MKNNEINQILQKIMEKGNDSIDFVISNGVEIDFVISLKSYVNLIKSRF